VPECELIATLRRLSGNTPVPGRLSRFIQYQFRWCVADSSRRNCVPEFRHGRPAGTLYPVPCRHPAACLGAEPRIWVVGGAREKSPDQAVTPAQAAVLRPLYRFRQVKHVRSLTVFLLTRTPV
jgi:hypothetical protein